METPKGPQRPPAPHSLQPALWVVGNGNVDPSAGPLSSRVAARVLPPVGAHAHCLPPGAPRGPPPVSDPLLCPVSGRPRPCPARPLGLLAPKRIQGTERDCQTPS